MFCNDVSKLIIELLDPLDAIRLSATCKRWNLIVKNYNVYWFIQYYKLAEIDSDISKMFSVHDEWVTFNYLGNYLDISLKLNLINCFNDNDKNRITCYFNNNNNRTQIEQWRNEANQLINFLNDKNKVLLYKSKVGCIDDDDMMKHIHSTNSQYELDEFVLGYIKQQCIHELDIHVNCNNKNHHKIIAQKDVMKKYKSNIDYHRAYIISKYRYNKERVYDILNNNYITITHKKYSIERLKKKYENIKRKIQEKEDSIYNYQLQNQQLQNFIEDDIFENVEVLIERNK